MIVVSELIDPNACEGFGDEGVVRRLGHGNATDPQGGFQLHLDGFKDELAGMATRFDKGDGRDQPFVAEPVGCRDSHTSVQIKVH